MTKVKRVDTRFFIYCLYLKHKDAFYWGSTGCLQNRLNAHFFGKVKSTWREEYPPSLEEAILNDALLVYVKPYRTESEASQAETEAWVATGSQKNYYRNRYEGKGYFWDVIRNSDQTAAAVHRHLLGLGWRNRPVPLSAVLSMTTSNTWVLDELLKIWDEFDELAPA